jgi:hypothetical protein
MFSRKLSIISLVLIVAIFLTITGNVVFFSKILNTSLSENLSYIEENKIIIKIDFALYRLLISNKMVARTTETLGTIATAFCAMCLSLTSSKSKCACELII